MSSISVHHIADDQFVIDVRQHRITVDQPIGEGGADTAPTPTELFVASLASCVAFYARRYLSRHAIPTDDFSVTAEYSLAVRPARVDTVRVDIAAPTLTDDQRTALLAVASHCTVHNTLVHEPEVVIEIASDVAVA